MNKILNKAKSNVINQKKKYLFLSVIMLIGIISGVLFIFFVSKEDKLQVKEQLELFLVNIKNKNLNNFSSLINSLLSNGLYIVSFWILGISIIGIPIIVFLLFLKSFIFGFSIASIIYNYGFKGIMLAIVYQIPHNLVYLVLLLLLSFYAINFSIKLFRVLFLKENISLSLYFKRYNKILLVCIVCSIVCSIFEIFVTPVLINLFL